MQLPKELTTVTPLSKSIALVLFVALPIIAFVLGMQYQTVLENNKNQPPPGSVACTADAKLCPDGSSVGRSGPNCEFAACPSVVPTAVKDSSVSGEMKTYTNKEAGFSLKYPSNVKLSVSTNSYIPDESSPLTITVLVRKIDSIVQDAPWRYTKDSALNEEVLLQKGQFGNNYDFVGPYSKGIIRVGNLNAKSFIVFGRFHSCSIVFERQLVFYNKGYQIILDFSTSTNEIIKNNPRYFSIPTPPMLPCWNTSNGNNTERLYNDLKAKNVSSQLLDWYDGFDSIIKSIIIN